MQTHLKPFFVLLKRKPCVSPPTGVGAAVDVEGNPNPNPAHLVGDQFSNDVGGVVSPAQVLWNLWLLLLIRPPIMVVLEPVCVCVCVKEAGTNRDIRSVI